MLELAVLGLLKEMPMSGYELRKQLSVKLGAFGASASARSTRASNGSRRMAR